MRAIHPRSYTQSPPKSPHTDTHIHTQQRSPSQRARFIVGFDRERRGRSTLSREHCEQLPHYISRVCRVPCGTCGVRVFGAIILCVCVCVYERQEIAMNARDAFLQRRRGGMIVRSGPQPERRYHTHLVDRASSVGCFDRLKTRVYAPHERTSRAAVLIYNLRTHTRTSDPHSASPHDSDIHTHSCHFVCGQHREAAAPLAELRGRAMRRPRAVRKRGVG